MGFRDLRAFNLALLAKEGWWLQQGRNSIFCRVFKNKKFPDEDFIHAKKKATIHLLHGVVFGLAITN